VTVKIVTPEQNNWRGFANYARLESARSGIDLRLFQGGMSHLKAMLIDGEYLIAGSSNFDYLSYRIHQELLAIITNPRSWLTSAGASWPLISRTPAVSNALPVHSANNGSVGR